VGCQIEGVPRPWSSELAAALRRDREELLVLFVVYRSKLRDAEPTAFDGGEDEQKRLLQETEHDYVALVSAGAEAARLGVRCQTGEPSDRPRSGKCATPLYTVNPDCGNLSLSRKTPAS
jgi:hypothetical protein